MTESILPKQYVAVGNYGFGEQLTVVTTDDIRRTIEHAHYSGDSDEAGTRYFQFHAGAMREVEVRAIKSTEADSDDYLSTRFGIFQKDSSRGADAKAFDFFTVIIDGRA